MRVKQTRPALKQVVAGIYDAALDLDQWKTVITDIAAYGHSSFAILTWRDEDRPHAPLAVRVETGHTQLLDEYFKGPMQSDPIVRMMNEAPDNPRVNDEWEPRERFVNSERYKRFFREWNIEDRASIVVLPGPDWKVGALTLARGHREDRFDRRSLAPLRELSPHIRRSLQIASKFRWDAAHANSLATALDNVADGVFLVDATNRVVYSNAAAKDLIKRGMLTVCHDRLRAPCASDSIALEKLLNRVIKTGEGAETDPGGSIELHQQDGTACAMAIASPLRIPESKQHFGPRPPRAVMFIRELKMHAPTAPEALRGRFGLTRAEARVATELEQGFRLQEIADRHGLTKETIRSHLHAIFDKTGARRQSDVVKVLLTCSDRIPEARISVSGPPQHLDRRDSADTLRSSRRRE